jgi:exodeoxyribonuclease-3
MVTVSTVNVNGIRAAARKGMGEWWREATPDVVCLQEVRASTEDLVAALPDGYDILHDPCVLKGRAGVAIASRLPMVAKRVGLGLAGDVNTGRWVEADVAVPGWTVPLTVASAYVHVGELGTEKQVLKHEFLAAMTRRMADLGGRGVVAPAPVETVDGGAHRGSLVGPAPAGAADGDGQVGSSGPGVGPLALVCGDINVAHTQRDIRNWRGNVGKRGFTAEERAHLTTWAKDLGWVDVGRQLAGDVDGPYTWWSWRGRAFDNDAGWRIDYHLATPALAVFAEKAHVDRAPTWDTRWSDHSPLTVEYQEAHTNE